MQEFDIIIIGGGISGMTAGIYAARSNMSVCILEQEICGGLVNWTYSVENFPSYLEIKGMDLMAKCREHAASLGVSIYEVDAVESVDLFGDIKKVVTVEGEVFSAPAVIIATGRTPLPLPVDTDWQNIHYCSICDGTAYKDKDVLVVGGGNSGFDESLYLAGLGVKSIMIVEYFPKCIAAETTQQKAKQVGNISVRVSTQILSIEHENSDKGLVTLKDLIENKEYKVLVDGIFCFIGQKPNTDIFNGIVDMENGYIKSNLDMSTNVPGVYSAGDVNVKKYRQITTGMSDGTIAALEAVAYVKKMRERKN